MLGQPAPAVAAVSSLTTLLVTIKALFTDPQLVDRIERIVAVAQEPLPCKQEPRCLVSSDGATTLVAGVAIGIIGVLILGHLRRAPADGAHRVSPSAYQPEEVESDLLGVGDSVYVPRSTR